MIRLQISMGAGKLTLGKRQLKAVMRAAGREVAAVARRLAGSAGSGRTYYGPGGSAKAYRGGYIKGRYRASAPGQPPAKITGTLARSFAVRPFQNGEGVVIRDTAFYSRFMETGAVGGGRKGGKGAAPRRGQRKRLAITGRILAPRPFLTVALGQRAASIEPRIREAVAQDIKFVRMRP